MDNLCNNQNKVRKFILFTAILLFICFTTSSCQPTPEIPVIVNKGDGTLEQKLTKSPQPAQAYNVPAHWKETVKKEKLAIEIDADLKLPGVKEFPVIKVEPAIFTQKRVDELVNYFAAGKKLYEMPRIKTKVEYEKDIIEAKRGQEIDGKFVVTGDSKAWVKELEERMRKAPVSSPKVYTDTKLRFQNDQDGKIDKDSGENFLNVSIEDSEGNTIGTIYVSNFEEDKNEATSLYYSRGEYISEFLIKLNLEEEKYPDVHYKERLEIFKKCEQQLSQIQINKEDALSQAEKLIKDLNIQDMMLLETEKIVHVFSEGDDSKLPTVDNKGGYLFHYMRQNGGIPSFMITSWGTNKGEEPPTYAPPFHEERLDIGVTNQGIVSVNWDGCVKPVETVSANVTLLPFDKMQQAVISQITYKKSFEAGYLENITVFVNSAELRMGYINIKDTMKQALMVPVWVFHTTEKCTNLAGNAIDGNKDDYLFNAVDGGVIGMRMPDDRKE